MSRPDSSGSIRLLISDPTRLGCSLLGDALERKRFTVVASATSESELVQAAGRFKPDIILINLSQPIPAVLRMIEHLRGVQPSSKCVLVTGSLSRAEVVNALRAGIRGIFSPENGPEQLYRCLRATHAGQYWLNSSEMSLVMDALSDNTIPQITDTQGQILLTPREHDVVALVAEGLTNRDVSKHLQISEHTVKNYLFRVFDKLGVSSRAELILYALSQKDKRPRETSRLHSIV